INELPQICIERRDAALLVVFTVFGRIESCRHLCPECGQIFLVVIISGSKSSVAAFGKQSSKASLELGTFSDGEQPTRRRTMSLRHERSSILEQWFTVPDERPANMKAGDNLGVPRIEDAGAQQVLPTGTEVVPGRRQLDSQRLVKVRLTWRR